MEIKYNIADPAQNCHMDSGSMRYQIAAEAPNPASTLSAKKASCTGFEVSRAAIRKRSKASNIAQNNSSMDSMVINGAPVAGRVRNTA